MMSVSQAGGFTRPSRHTPASAELMVDGGLLPKLELCCLSTAQARTLQDLRTYGSIASFRVQRETGRNGNPKRVTCSFRVE
jgi:hypothetical protein